MFWISELDFFHNSALYLDLYLVQKPQTKKWSVNFLNLIFWTTFSELLLVFLLLVSFFQFKELKNNLPVSALYYIPKESAFSAVRPCFSLPCWSLLNTLLFSAQFCGSSFIKCRSRSSEKKGDFAFIHLILIHNMEKKGWFWLEPFG